MGDSIENLRFCHHVHVVIVIGGVSRLKIVFVIVGGSSRESADICPPSLKAGGLQAKGIGRLSEQALQLPA